MIIVIFTLPDTGKRVKKNHKVGITPDTGSSKERTEIARTISLQYLNCRTYHLNESVEHTCPLCFERFPIEKTLIYSECCNGLPMTEANVLRNTTDKCINTLLQTCLRNAVRKTRNKLERITIVSC